MPQINLLKQKSPTQNASDLLPSVGVKVLFVVLLGVIGYYGWSVFRSQSLTQQIAKTNSEISADIQTALNTKEYNEVLTRQAQLSQLSALIDSHAYFSNLLPELADATLKTATYAGIQATAGGTISMVVKVPSISDIDKFLQVFDIPKFNQNFNNVKIGAFHKIQTKDSVSYGFNLEMSYNTAAIKYHTPTTLK